MLGNTKRFEARPKFVSGHPTVLAVGVGEVFRHVSLPYHISFLPLSLWKKARYKPKYFIKEPLN